MTISARICAHICITLLLVGCASNRPKEPDYSDAQLRPINQGVVDWMRRMNVVPPGIPASADQHDGPAHPLKTASSGQNTAYHQSEHRVKMAGQKAGAEISVTREKPGPARSMREAVTALAKASGWKLYWDATKADPKTRALSTPPEFEQQLDALVRSSTMPGVKYPLQIDVYPKQNIVHVTDAAPVSDGTDQQGK